MEGLIVWLPSYAPLRIERLGDVLVSASTGSRRTGAEFFGWIWMGSLGRVGRNTMRITKR